MNHHATFRIIGSVDHVTNAVWSKGQLSTGQGHILLYNALPA